MLDDVIEEGFLVDDQSECDLKSEQADIEQYVIEYDTHRIVEIKDIQTETTAIKEILDIKDDLRMHELETLDEVEYVDDPDFVPDEINEENREFEAENMDGNKSKVIVKDNKLLKLFECVFCKVVSFSLKPQMFVFNKIFIIIFFRNLVEKRNFQLTFANLKQFPVNFAKRSSPKPNHFALTWPTCTGLAKISATSVQCAR